MWQAVAAQVATSLIADALSRGERDKAAGLLNEQLNAIRNLRVPTKDELAYISDKYSYLGDFTPEELHALYTLGPSAMEGVSTDPQLRADQLTALNKIRERALRGFSAEDQALLSEYLQSAASQAKSSQQQVMDDMQRRGAADSGVALISALQGSQGAANMMNKQALQTAAMRLDQEQRASEQLQRAAANLEGTDYERASELARTRDAIDRYNQTLRQDVLRTNVSNRNQANLRNLDTRQDISFRNTGESNLDKERQARAARDIFDMQARKAGLLSGATSAAANYHENRAGNIAGGIAGFGSQLINSIFK
ncbi:MAG: hypothetical protein ABIM30_01090 [candidate division WOR-3 bacterium]